MVEILSNLVLEYIEPLLKYSGVYIDIHGYLRPIGVSDDFKYTFEGKTVQLAKNSTDFNRLRLCKDEYELFNPFFIPRHMTFVCNLLKEKISDDELLLVAPDEDEIELDEDGNPIYEPVDAVEVFLQKNDIGESTYSLCFIDSNYNPIKEIASYTHEMPVLAMYGMCLNALRLYKPIMPRQLADTDVAINEILKGLAKYDRERKKKSIELTEYNNISVDYELSDYFVVDAPDDHYVDELNIDKLKGFIDPFTNKLEKEEIEKDSFTTIDFSLFKEINETEDDEEEDDDEEDTPDSKYDMLDLSF